MLTMMYSVSCHYFTCSSKVLVSTLKAFNRQLFSKFWRPFEMYDVFIKKFHFTPFSARASFSELKAFIDLNLFILQLADLFITVHPNLEVSSFCLV